jgi:hypothetical protein
MKELTLVLDDESLYTAIETEAQTSGNTIHDVVIQALQQWRADSELDAEEHAELSQARREWEKKGGVETHEFFDSLREEEARLDG